jgi:hypothetical protein
LEQRLGASDPVCARIRGAFHDLDDPDLARYRAVARQRASEGDLEVDHNALVSKGDDDGAYVMAWLWIGDDGA